MKRITLPIVALAAVVAGTAALAQNPPAPPARPTEPGRPATPAPAPRVATPPVHVYGPYGEFYTPRVDIEAVREAQREAQRAMSEVSRIDMDRVREESRAAMEASRVEMDRAREEMRIAMQDARPYSFSMPAIAPMTPMPAMPPIHLNFGSDRLDRLTPPAAWAQSDPADSIYRQARDVLNRGDWGRAARMFSDIQKNYPKSV